MTRSSENKKNIKIDSGLHTAIKTDASSKNMSIENYVEQALREKLEKNKVGNK